MPVWMIQKETTGVKTGNFFNLVDTDKTLFVVIKPFMLGTPGSAVSLADVKLADIEWFKECCDFKESEPRTPAECLFTRIMEKLTLSANSKGWTQTPLGQFYFTVFCA